MEVPPHVTAKIIDFAEARKKHRSRPKNRFAGELEEIASQIRMGNYDPEAMFIAFAVREDKIPQYPYADVNLTSAMITAILGHLQKRRREM